MAGLESDLLQFPSRMNFPHFSPDRPDLQGGGGGDQERGGPLPGRAGDSGEAPAGGSRPG